LLPPLRKKPLTSTSFPLRSQGCVTRRFSLRPRTLFALLRVLLRSGEQGSCLLKYLPCLYPAPLAQVLLPLGKSRLCLVEQVCGIHVSLHGLCVVMRLRRSTLLFQDTGR
jgi:hypothetical protein